jgi:molecular chaperone GrpE
MKVKITDNKDNKGNTDNKDGKDNVTTAETAATTDTAAETVSEEEVAAETVEQAQEKPILDEVAILKEQLLRQAAEYDNYRKRTAKERLELEPDITAKIVTKFLPVFDNIERAMSSHTEDAEYKKGIEMIYASFNAVLKDMGVEEVSCEGQFDPNVHQAVQQTESDEESGTITLVLQKGYTYRSKVIRFAMVAVAR